MSLGLVVPLETYSQGPAPAMIRHLERVQLGFAAIWLREVPFNVPSFGDAGQLYDPFVLTWDTDRAATIFARI